MTSLCWASLRSPRLGDSSHSWLAMQRWRVFQRASAARTPLGILDARIAWTGVTLFMSAVQSRDDVGFHALHGLRLEDRRLGGLLDRHLFCEGQFIHARWGRQSFSRRLPCSVSDSGFRRTHRHPGSLSAWFGALWVAGLPKSGTGFTLATAALSTSATAPPAGPLLAVGELTPCPCARLGRR